MERGNGQSSKIPPTALWVIMLGAGASGVTGIGALGQLDQLNTAIEEQIRVAELRGKLLAEIRANRNLIESNQLAIQKTMTREGVLRLHDGQQALIDKLLDWTGTTVTRNELELTLRKLRRINTQ